MKLIYNSIFLDHDTGMHPENRKRLIAMGDLKETTVKNGEEYLSLVHNDDYIEFVKDACKTGGHVDKLLNQEISLL
jgi:acetoin utilization deacetylase AcuC-like enzyme